MKTIIEMSDINTISTNNVSDDVSLNCGGIGNNLGLSTPVTTPEPKSLSNPSGSRSEIHYPGVQNPSRIYDSKKNRKIVRIMTVMAYMFAVSLAAIVLSIYYAFLWNPNMQINNSTNTRKTNSAAEMGTDLEKSDDSYDNSFENQNQVQNQVLKNDAPIASSAQLLSVTDSRLSDQSELTTPSLTPTITTIVTNVQIVRNSVYPSNSLSENQEKENYSKLVPNNTNTNNTNVSSAVKLNQRISNKNIEIIERQKVENKTNQTEINRLVDNQIESLNRSSSAENTKTDDNFGIR